MKIISYIKRYSSYLYFLIYFSLMLLIFSSVFRSGVHFLFNGDEYTHLQTVYLIAKGEKIYDTFFAGYPAVFYWLLLPFLKLVGFGTQTLIFARFIMVILFALRIVITFFLTYRLFGKTAAWFFIPLFLADPFNIYTGMQVRPDNLMLLFFAAGYLLLAQGLLSTSKKIIFFSGSFMALSLITLIKITPSIAILFPIFFAFAVAKKIFKLFLVFCGGFLLPIILYAGYFFLQNNLLPAITHSFAAGFIIAQKTLISYAPLTMIYGSGNDYIYGLSGKPPTWTYVWLVMILAGMGVFYVFSEAVKKAPFSKSAFLKIGLAFCLGAQWISLIKTNSVFPQYILPVSGFYAIFAAAALEGVFINLKKYKRVSYLVLFLITIFIAYFSYYGYMANDRRATMNNNEQLASLDNIWKNIPEEENVFPYLLFRPIALPIAGKYPLPQVLPFFKEEVNVRGVLEQNRVKYIMNDEEIFADLEAIDPKGMSYLKTNYQFNRRDIGVWEKTGPIDLE